MRSGSVSVADESLECMEELCYFGDMISVGVGQNQTQWQESKVAGKSLENCISSEQ